MGRLDPGFACKYVVRLAVHCIVLICGHCERRFRMVLQWLHSFVTAARSASAAFEALPVARVSPGERQALVSLYFALGGPQWTDATGWRDYNATPSVDPCSPAWTGVVCATDASRASFSVVYVAATGGDFPRVCVGRGVCSSHSLARACKDPAHLVWLCAYLMRGASPLCTRRLPST